MSTEKDHHRAALITGASSGIGAALAEIFAQEGYRLILTARNQARLAVVQTHLRNVYGVTVDVFARDLAEDGAAKKIFDWLGEAGISIDILVNNAGLGSFGPFYTEDVSREREMMMVNIVALTQLTRCILPGMIARHGGKILNVASVASFVPGPSMSVYFASKAYVLSFSNAIAEELRNTGVTVTALCPGPTKTAFFDQEGGVQSKNSRDPHVVARYGYAALMKGERIAIQDGKYKFLFFLKRFVPRWLVVRIVARMMQ